MSSEWRTLWNDVLSNSSGNLSKCNTQRALDVSENRSPSPHLIYMASYLTHSSSGQMSSTQAGRHTCTVKTYISCSSCITILSIMCGMCAGTFLDVNPNLLFRILLTYRSESANVSCRRRPVRLLSVKYVNCIFSDSSSWKENSM